MNIQLSIIFLLQKLTPKIWRNWEEITPYNKVRKSAVCGAWHIITAQGKLVFSFLPFSVWVLILLSHSHFRALNFQRWIIPKMKVSYSRLAFYAFYNLHPHTPSPWFMSTQLEQRVLQRLLNKGFTFYSSTGKLIGNLFRSRVKNPEGRGEKNFVQGSK